MNSDRFRIAGILLAIATVPALVYVAYSMPGYFTSWTYLGGILFLEFLIAAVWWYRRVFFPILVISFLLAGTAVPFSSAWSAGRWAVLAVGAMVGLALVMKTRGYSFGGFHLIACFAVLTAMVSSLMSQFVGVSVLKVISLLLLFLYAATGARLAVQDREDRFYRGMVLGCEIFVFVVAAAYAGGFQLMGNPNSLGAVMGVVAAPVLLWATLNTIERNSYLRRLFLLVVALGLVFSSHARAGMLAAFVSCSLLCLALRKYRLLIGGFGLIAIMFTGAAIVRPEAVSRAVSSLSSSVIYKGKDPAGGWLESRNSPWQDAIDEIQDHFWFGTGFGTADKSSDVGNESVGTFSTTIAVSTEHGSSYLAVMEWVGIAGILPFAALIVLPLAKVLRTLRWMFRTRQAMHPAVPLAMIVLAGLIHAGFEDWLFAPGYYLCVFYWCVVFIFVDQVRSLEWRRNPARLWKWIEVAPHKVPAAASGQ